MHSFVSPTKIIVGNEDIEKVYKKYRKIFVVTDAFMHKNGQVDYVASAFPKEAQYEVFSEVLPDPDTSVISQGMARLMSFEPDLVVALGGGSPIDAAKAMVHFAKNEFGFKDMKFIAIPTTSGSGSEVTKFAVVTNASTHIKTPIVADELLPDIAILDSQLTLTIPPKITADTGIDVLAHAIEAFVSVRANDFSDACAQKAMQLVYANLKRVYNKPDDVIARQSMHNASCLAGIAFSNAGLGLCHAMAHALGGKFRIPHGRANALLLPYVMSYNAGCGDKQTPSRLRYAEIGVMLDFGHGDPLQTARNMIRHVQSLIRSLDMPFKISQTDIKEQDFLAALDELAKTAINDGCLVDNPESVTEEDIKRVYKNAFYGRSH